MRGGRRSEPRAVRLRPERSHDREEYRDRGLTHLQRRAFRAAVADLNHYLTLSPMADDRQLVAARAAEALSKAKMAN